MSTSKPPAQIRSERVRGRIRETLDVIRSEIETSPKRVYPGEKRLTVAEITRRASASRNTVEDMEEVHELLAWYRAIHAKEASNGKRAKPDYLQALDKSERLLRLQDADRLAMQVEIKRYQEEIARLTNRLAECEAVIEGLSSEVDPQVVSLHSKSSKDYWDD
tara:strand:- start:687 stop:1175 length:489 start_codon:yes stop_codon:yes gene_type:complete